MCALLRSACAPYMHGKISSMGRWSGGAHARAGAVGVTLLPLERYSCRAVHLMSIVVAVDATASGLALVDATQASPMPRRISHVRPEHHDLAECWGLRDQVLESCLSSDRSGPHFHNSARTGNSAMLIGGQQSHGIVQLAVKSPKLHAGSCALHTFTQLD